VWPQRASCLAAALSLCLATGALASTAGLATATLSSSKAGARHVTMTVSLTTELQCGRLMGSRTLVVTLPAKARIAKTVPATAVLVSGKAVGEVAVAGRVLTLSLAPPRGAICDSITTGIAKVVVTAAAGLRNPATPGGYTVRVAHGAETFSAPLKIRS
jgi:hypothetical protein